LGLPSGSSVSLGYAMPSDFARFARSFADLHQCFRAPPDRDSVTAHSIFRANYTGRCDCLRTRYRSLRLAEGQEKECPLRPGKKQQLISFYQRPYGRFSAGLMIACMRVMQFGQQCECRLAEWSIADGRRPDRCITCAAAL